MQKPVTFLIILLCVITLSLNAQTVKPAFRSLTYVTYETSGAGKNVNVMIKDVLKIDASGKAHSRSVYYNGVGDTTYQLKESKLKELNAIFNGKKPLTQYIVRTEMKPGKHFAGPYDYLRYIDSNGKQHEITIASSFMSDDFNNALDYLVIGPSKADQKAKVIKDPELAAAIIKSEKATQNLPTIELPPPAMN